MSALGDATLRCLWPHLPRRVVGWLRRRDWTPDWDSPYACSFHNDGRVCPQSCWRYAEQPTCLIGEQHEPG